MKLKETGNYKPTCKQCGKRVATINRKGHCVICAAKKGEPWAAFFKGIW